MITTPIDVLYNVKNNTLTAPLQTAGYIQTGIQCFFKSQVKPARNMAHSANTSVLWTGVLYNRKELGYDDEDPVHHITTDTEVLLQLYEKHKDMEFVLRKLEGDFAFVLIDHRITEENSLMYVARDIAGVCPLFITPTRISSLRIYENTTTQQQPTILQKGCFHQFTMSSKVNAKWTIQMENKPYHIPAIPFKNFFHTPQQIQQYTQEYFQFAVYKRTLCCLDTKMACIMEEQENNPFLFEWMDGILRGRYEWVKQDELGEYAKDYVFFSISNKPYTTEQQLYGCEIYYPALDQDYLLYLQQLPEQKK